MPPRKKTSSPSKPVTSKSDITPSTSQRKPVGRRKKNKDPTSPEFVEASDHSAPSEIVPSSVNGDPFIVEDENGHSSSDFEVKSTHLSDESNSEEGNSDKEESEDSFVVEPATPLRRSGRKDIKPLIAPIKKGRERKRPVTEIVDSDDNILISESNSHKKSKAVVTEIPRETSLSIKKRPMRLAQSNNRLNKGKMTSSALVDDDKEDLSMDEEIVVKPLAYFEDYDKHISVPLLKKCGVFNKAFEDPLLKGTYNNLIKLPSGKSIETWKKLFGDQTGSTEEPRFIMFSTVQSYFPDAPISEIKRILVYSGDKISGFANLSRINPAELTYKPPRMGFRSSFICYRGQDQPAKLLMMGIVVKDQTHEPFQLPGPKGNWMKSFTICPFALEFERNVAAACVITGVDSFSGQIFNNELTFSTRQGPLDDAKSALSSPSKSGRTPILAGPSAMVKQSPVGSYKKNISARGPSDNIPILDARGKVLNLPTDLKTIENDLQTFNQPVPADSVALVCYTNGGYMKDDKFHLSHNILWSAILAGSDFDW